MDRQGNHGQARTRLAHERVLRSFPTREEQHCGVKAVCGPLEAQSEPAHVRFPTVGSRRGHGLGGSGQRASTSSIGGALSYVCTTIMRWRQLRVAENRDQPLAVAPLRFASHRPSITVATASSREHPGQRRERWRSPSQSVQLAADLVAPPVVDPLYGFSRCSTASRKRRGSQIDRGAHRARLDARDRSWFVWSRCTSELINSIDVVNECGHAFDQVIRVRN